MPQDLSQMSTEELLRLRGNRQSAPQGPVFGPAPAPPKPPAPPAPPRETEVFRTLTPQEAAAQGLPEGGVYQMNAAGKVQVIQAPARSRDGGAIPVNASTAAKESIAQYNALTRALDTFQDTYAGNTITGELENTANAYLGLGTPGQSEWWADFRATDNLIRNALFGASLTEGEKAAYNQTTIQPGMSPEKVRANLKRRAEIVRNALDRDKEFFLANGYKPEAVEALFAPLARVTASEEANVPIEGDGLTDIRVTDESLWDINGRQLYDANGQMLMQGYEGQTYYEDGSEGPFVGRVTDETRNPDATDPLASAMFGQFGRAMNAFGEVSGEAATLGFADELRGIGGAIGAALRGEDIGAGYERGRQAQMERSAAAKETMGAATLPVQLLTGGAGGRAVSGVQAGLNTARRIAATGAPVTRQAIQSNLTRRAGGAGAAIGALAGAGNGETIQQRATNALLGAGGGYALGAGGQAISNRLANRVTPAADPNAGAETMRAADELGIDVIPAVVGGTTTRRLTAGARQGFISDRPIASAVERMEGQAQAARATASQAAGRATDKEAAGEIVRKGAQVYSQRTSAIGGRLYDRADRMAEGVKVPLPNAVKVLDEEIAQLEQSPTSGASSLLKELKDLRGQIAGGEFTIPGIRSMRTDLREQIVQRGLRGSPSDRIYNRVLQASEDDAITGLRNQGRDNAAGAMQTARDFWRVRVETIDEVLDPLLGKNAPRSGEQILSALENMAKAETGNAANLRRLMQAMPKGEADAVRATVINRLGRPTAGAAEVDREGFSFNTFLTNWNNMSPRARATLFPPESREVLDRLATVSQGVKQAGTATNTSNTAGALGVQTLLTGAGWWALEPLQLGGGLLAQYGAGRLLASPRFARLIAGAPRQNTPQARQALSARLGNLARAEPAIANEIGAYQRALAANDNNMVGSVAAEEQNQQPRQ